MIINKNNKSYQIRSDAADFNWLKSDEWYIVPDNSPLAQKVQKLFPRFEFVLDDNNELIDVLEIPKTQEEINKERAEEIKTELNNLDVTINRATEDLYALTEIIPYENIQNVISRKIELRNELKTINGGV